MSAITAESPSPGIPIHELMPTVRREDPELEAISNPSLARRGESVARRVLTGVSLVLVGACALLAPLTEKMPVLVSV